MNESQRRSYAALHGTAPARAGDFYARLRAGASKGQLHGGVRGAHPTHGGMETPQADIDADDTRFGPEAKFTQGPEGRDTMGAGGDVWPTPKEHTDTTPYRTRPKEQGTQLPLGTAGAFQPNDIALHYARLKNPHLNEYHLERVGDDYGGHEVRAYHGEHKVGFLRWSGANGDEEHAPGEIQGVSVHPDHRGKELSTAMWDYARVHVATQGIQEPIHSADRSTAGNHWAHFVGGKSMARNEGHDVDEYFKEEWR